MRPDTIRNIIIGLLLGAIVAFAGHYYAMHDPGSKKDSTLAYLLGISVAIFTYLFLAKRALERLNKEKSLNILAEQIQQQEPSYYDHEFCFNRLKKGFSLFIFIVFLGAGIYFICIGRLIMGGLLILPFSFILPSALKDFKDKTPQIRIADSGIWTKDNGFTPWEKIRSIHIRRDRSGKSETAKLDIFRADNDSKNADETIQIDEIKQWKDIGVLLESMGKTAVSNDYH